MKVNPGKQVGMEVEGQTYLRLPIRTRIITAADDIILTAQEYTQELIEPEDVVIVSEKVVAITQGRSISVEQLQPSRLAIFLSKFVYKSPYGVGLGNPHTMELALREVGRVKLVVAALFGALGKLVGIRGLFYRICGDSVRSIDAPCHTTVPPYDQHVILGPENPELVAKNLAAALGCAVAIVDANDLGVNILGVSDPEVDQQLLIQLLKDNPLGQSREQTPFGIIRKAAPEGATDVVL